MSAEPPSLSVVVVTKDTARTLRPIVAALRAQTIAASIEVIVVAPDERAGALPEADRLAFRSVQVVAAGPITSRGRAAARGVLVARAPIVALSENHCFPANDWAERTLASHAGPWAGVGPAVVNANPESPISRAVHAFGYGSFPRTGVSGVVAQLPLHNSSYRRSVLPTSLPDLEPLLGDERNLHRHLRDHGHELYFDTGPIKRHINEATWWLISGLSYSNGRRYGGDRSSEWGMGQRALYIIGAPLLSIPIARHIWSKRSAGEDVRHGLTVACVVWYCALLHAIGEAVSYAVGPRHEFPFVENEEFLIRERLGGHAIADREVSAFVARLDDESATSRL